MKTVHAKRCRLLWSAGEETEQGQALVMFLLLLPLILVVAGLVFDGGMMYLHWRWASTAANLGAQAAGHAIDEEYFAETNRIRLDRGRAAQFAQQYVSLNSRGPIRVTRVTIRYRQVIVEARTVYQTTFMRLFGIPAVEMRVVGRAYPAYGIDREGQ